MSSQFQCKTDMRRPAVRDSALNGIDFLEVLDHGAPGDALRQRLLLVHLYKPAAGLSALNVLVTGGVRPDRSVNPVRVLWAAMADAIPDEIVSRGWITDAQRQDLEDRPDAGGALVVHTSSTGDYSDYRLRLVASQVSEEPPAGFDPPSSEVDFTFKVECRSDFDCAPERVCPPESPDEPLINYMAKDYAAFRRLMLDRISTLAPGWSERHPADIGVTLVEILAYAADHLSYYQDAVATEAYLGTARRRVSMRRHARLLGYRMHEGCNARAWVHLPVAADFTLPAGALLMTRFQPSRGTVDVEAAKAGRALGALTFTTMHDADLRSARNEIAMYTWGEEECCLPRGATRATLRNRNGTLADLAPGDVLLFEEARGAGTGRLEDADPAHRHTVRLTQVAFRDDPLFPEDEENPGVERLHVVDVTWHEADAMPFALCLSTVVGSRRVAGISVARGNLVLADEGLPVAEPLPPAPVDGGPYAPTLAETGVTHAVPFEAGAARKQPAAAALEQDPRAALPSVTLVDGVETWTARSDLLASGRFDRHFVVEVDDEGRAALRFGDGVLGQVPLPGAARTARYRTGAGRAGNVGAEAIAHAVSGDGRIGAIRNPLPARGGADPEPVEQVRLYAPRAFRTQERAVTEADYGAMAQRHPDVQRAVATRRWTGSWHTFFVTVDRKGGRAVDGRFREEMRAFLEPFRLAGHDVEVEAPLFVPLDVALDVCAAPGHFPADVKRALLDALGGRDLPDGRRGFFHPDNFTFGQTVYLSQLVAAAMRAPGVAWVDVTRFQRWGRTARGERQAGRLTLGRLEIAQMANDPSLPENGRLEIEMKGIT
ncbi:MAG TPA: putative baseplate assembly protein [Armatimonadota bacterium]|jgi:hypothetical protein